MCFRNASAAGGGGDGVLMAMGVRGGCIYIQTLPSAVMRDEGEG